TLEKDGQGCGYTIAFAFVHRFASSFEVSSGRRFVRNPMYIGAGMTLAGAALYYESLSILFYTGLFFLITRLFVVFYEEPTFRRTFGDDYEAYCRRTTRWWPTRTKK